MISFLVASGVRGRSCLPLRAAYCLPYNILTPPWRLQVATSVRYPPLRGYGAKLLPAAYTRRKKAESRVATRYPTVSKALNDIVASLKQHQQEGEVVKRAMESLVHVHKKTSRELQAHPLYPEIQQLLLTSVSRLTPSQAGHMIWLYASFRFRDVKLIETLVNQLQGRVGDLDERTLKLVCRSLMQLRFDKKSHQLLGSIASELFSRLAQSKADLDYRSISDVCWSFTVAGWWPAQLTNPLIQFLESHMSQIPLHPLSVMLWSMVKMGVTETILFGNVAHEVSKEIRHADVQSLCMLIWCYGRLSLYHPEFFHQLTEEILNRRKKYSPRLLATLVWTCTRVRYYHPELMDHIAQHSLKMLGDLSTHDLSLLAYGFGYLNHSCPEMMQAVAEKIVAVPHPSTNQALVNTAWGCLAAGIYPVNLFQLVVRQVETMKNSPRSVMESFQMLQLDMASRVEHPHLCLPRLSPEQLVTMFMEVIDNYQLIIQHSQYESNMHLAAYRLLGNGELFRCQTLSLSGYELDTEMLLDKDNKPVAVPESCYTLHVDRAKEILASQFQLEGASLQQMRVEDSCRWESLVVASDWGVLPEEVMGRVARRVVLEADGVYHYAANCHQPLGRTVLKHRQLRALGWDVISIPYYEWHPLNSVEEQAGYLKQALEHLVHT